MLHPNHIAAGNPARDSAGGRMSGRAPQSGCDRIRAEMCERGPGKHESDGELADLMNKVRTGDREASALFISKFGARIRRRVRGKLSPAMRRLFDSQEILATVARRLDALVSKGQMQAVSDGQVWSLVFTIAENSLIEKARVYRSLVAKEGQDSALAESLLSRLRAAERYRDDGPELEIDKALRSLGDRVDRQILSLWLMGRDAASIGVAVDMTPATVRKRWERIRGRLREAYLSGEC